MVRGAGDGRDLEISGCDVSGNHWERKHVRVTAREYVCDCEVVRYLKGGVQYSSG
jgi:hypothetical protein